MIRGGRRHAWVMVMLALAWATAAAAAQSSTPPAPDPSFDFSGYRIPAQNWRSWFVNGTGSGTSDEERSGDFNTRHRTAQGNFQAMFDSGHDSDPLYYDCSVRLFGHGMADFVNSRVDTLSQQGDQRHLDEQWQLNGSVRSYPGEISIGIAASVFLVGEYSQDWLHQEAATNGQPTSFYDHALKSYDYLLQGRVGPVVGRVRDAGSVYQAWLFERRLVRDGTLIRPLTAEARARLADLFSVQYGYGIAHQFPNKAFWSEVEKLVHEDGALPDSAMNAYGLMHALDPMVGGATYDARQIGWLLNPFLAGTHRHTVLRGSSPNPSRTTLSLDDVLAGMAAEYHHPIGIGWQVDLSGQIAADVKGIHRSQVCVADASVRYRFAERWLLRLSAEDQRLITHENNWIDFWSVTAQAGAEYQLEDHWRLSLALQQDQRHQSDLASYSTRVMSAVFGVTWSWGRFDAPGLIAPVRPLAVGPP
jgi:hypothetical protein